MRLCGDQNHSSHLHAIVAAPQQTVFRFDTAFSSINKSAVSGHGILHSLDEFE